MKRIDILEGDIEKLERKFQSKSIQLKEVSELLDESMAQLDKKEYINKELTEVVKTLSQNQKV